MSADKACDENKVHAQQLLRKPNMALNKIVQRKDLFLLHSSIKILSRKSGSDSKEDLKRHFQFNTIVGQECNMQGKYSPFQVSCLFILSGAEIQTR